jgi:hypothetical protein
MLAQLCEQRAALVGRKLVDAVGHQAS